MNIEEFRTYCLSKKGVTESIPFDEHILIFKVMNDKMFALTSLRRVPHSVNLKCDPDKSIELRDEYDGAIIPGWHMNKKHWNTCFLDDLSLEVLHSLIDHSYDLAVLKLTKKLKAELTAL